MSEKWGDVLRKHIKLSKLRNLGKINEVERRIAWNETLHLMAKNTKFFGPELSREDIKAFKQELLRMLPN